MFRRCVRGSAVKELVMTRYRSLQAIPGDKLAQTSFGVLVGALTAALAQTACLSVPSDKTGGIGGQDGASGGAQNSAAQGGSIHNSEGGARAQDASGGKSTTSDGGALIDAGAGGDATLPSGAGSTAIDHGDGGKANGGAAGASGGATAHGGGGASGGSSSSAGTTSGSGGTEGTSNAGPVWAAWRMPNWLGMPNPSSYTDQTDGTVRDNVTGLLWQQT